LAGGRHGLERLSNRHAILRIACTTRIASVTAQSDGKRPSQGKQQ
jgi:hypothetical protein